MQLEDAARYVMWGRTSERRLKKYHLILAPTHNCDLRCKHCYLPDHSSDLMSEEVVMRVVDEWADIVRTEVGRRAGIFHLKGGEPFIVPYIGKVVEKVIARGDLSLMFTTNGLFRRTGTLELLQEAGNTLRESLTVIVSIDGASAPSHESLRGTGTFAKTIENARQISRSGARVHINCVLHEQNQTEVLGVLGLARDIGASQINFLPYVPKGIGLQMLNRRARPRTLHEILLDVYSSLPHADRLMLAGSLAHIVHVGETPGMAPAHECTVGYRGLLYVTPEGNTFSCPNLLLPEHRLGNVHEDSLRDILDRCPSLRLKLHRPEANSDRFICTGERVLYEKRGDRSLVAGLQELQASMSQSVAHDGEIAYCVSRNF